MNQSRMKKFLRFVVWIAVLAGLLYGLGRLYFQVTGGFTVGNITSDFKYDAKRDARPLQAQERALVTEALDQNYRYLGKGCQSYVFLSDDGKYVIKFMKYQRFRTPFWLDALSFIPPIENYRRGKIEKKQKKLNYLFQAWVLAFNELQQETGLVYVHLNKTSNLHKALTIFDKLGIEHTLDLDQMEFLVQKKADMFCPTIDQLMAEGKSDEVKTLIDRLIAMVLFEYGRGLADNDHALMQNTGIIDGKPVHIDVGQFIRREDVRKPETANQELYSKTYKFRRWLRKKYPSIADYLEAKLIAIMGQAFYELKPIVKKHNASDWGDR